MKYYVVTFTHKKIVGWAIYLGASYQIIQWDPKFGECQDSLASLARRIRVSFS